MLVTPDGRVVRLADGQVLTSGLGEVWYHGPTVDRDVVYQLGGRARDAVLREGGVQVGAWRLTRSGETVSARPLWSALVPADDVFYSAPVLHEGRLYAVQANGRLWALDASDGSVYPAPTIAGDRLFVGTDMGWAAMLAPGDGVPRVVQSRLGRYRASPWFEGTRLYLRAEGALICVDAAVP